MSRSRLAKLQGILQFFVAAGAYPAGILMMIYTDGSTFGLPRELLADSPFDSYIIPGILLILVNGVLQTLGGVISFKQLPLAGRFGMALGLLLICWILVQIAMIRELHWLHFLYLGIGILESRFGYLLTRYDVDPENPSENGYRL